MQTTFMFLRSKKRFNIFGRFCLSRDSSWNFGSLSAKTIIGIFKSLTDATYFLARQAQQLSRLRKECVYFQTKTQQSATELCFRFSPEDIRPKSAKAKMEEM